MSGIKELRRVLNYKSKLNIRTSVVGEEGLESDSVAPVAEKMPQKTVVSKGRRPVLEKGSQRPAVDMKGEEKERLQQNITAKERKGEEKIQESLVVGESVVENKEQETYENLAVREKIIEKENERRNLATQEGKTENEKVTVAGEKRVEEKHVITEKGEQITSIVAEEDDRDGEQEENEIVDLLRLMKTVILEIQRGKGMKQIMASTASLELLRKTLKEKYKRELEERKK